MSDAHHAAGDREELLDQLLERLPLGVWVWRSHDHDPAMAELVAINPLAAAIRNRPDLGFGVGSRMADLDPSPAEAEEFARVLDLRGTDTVLDLGSVDRLVGASRRRLRRVAFALDTRTIAVLMEDITALVTAESGRVAVLDRLLAVADDERRALADALHDDVIQRLAAQALALDSAARRESPGPAREALAGAAAGNRGAVESLRALIFELAPPAVDARRLGPGLERAAEHLLGGTGTTATVRVEVPVNLDEHLAVVAYRVAVEALANVARHARARTADVTVAAVGDDLVVEVADDGVGAPPAALAAERPGHQGLRRVAERVGMLGGDLELLGGARGGTRLRATLPLVDEARDEVAAPRPAADWHAPQRPSGSAAPVRPELFVAATGDIVSCYGPDLRMQYINRAVRHVEGREPQEFLGRTPQESFGSWLGRLRQDQLAEVFRSGRTIRHVAETTPLDGVPSLYDQLFVPERDAPDAAVTRVWVWSRRLRGPGGPYDAGPPPAEPTGADDLLPPGRVRLVLEATPDLVGCLEGGRFLYVNAAMASFLALPPASIVGQRPDDLGMNVLEAVWEAVELALLTGRCQQVVGPLTVHGRGGMMGRVVTPEPGGTGRIWMTTRTRPDLDAAAAEGHT